MRHIYDVGEYQVLGRSEVETWYSLRSGGDVVSVVRWLGAAPATRADKAAWRAAGSPTTWALTGPEGKQSRGRDLSAAPGPREVSVMPDVSFDIGGTPLSYARIRALPTDPDVDAAGNTVTNRRPRTPVPPATNTLMMIIHPRAVCGHSRSKNGTYRAFPDSRKMARLALSRRHVP